MIHPSLRMSHYLPGQVVRELPKRFLPVNTYEERREPWVI